MQFRMIEKDNKTLYTPRNFNSIELWKNVTEEQWNDARWQKINSIRSVEHLKKVINLNSHQTEEIKRTLESLGEEGKEALRITPYYATLMQSDPFQPKLLFGEKETKRLVTSWPNPWIMLRGFKTWGMRT